MQDVVGYILILAAIVIPGYHGIKLAVRIMQALYQNTAIIVSFPF